MIDLYARLGVGFGADEASLRRALATTPDAELRRRVEGVLLVPAHRASYDAVLPALRNLQTLREGLMLEDVGWAQTPVLGDFHGGVPRPLRAPEPADAAPDTAALPAASGRRRWWPFGR